MTDSQQADLKFLLDEILSGDDERRARAQITLLAMDEDAVPPLLDAFYAGVNEAQGVVLLDVLTEIGGPEAVTLLTDVFHHPDKPAWQRWAALGLARNHRDDILDTLLAWLAGDSLPKRQTAALALGYIQLDAVDVALVHAMHDPDIAPHAIRALGIRGNITALADGYAVDDATLWTMITDTLLELGEEGTAPLVEILQSEHPDYYDKVLISLQNSRHLAAESVLRAAAE